MEERISPRKILKLMKKNAACSKETVLVGKLLKKLRRGKGDEGQINATG